MAILSGELHKLRTKASHAPDMDKLQASYEAYKKDALDAYAESDKPRLKNGSIGEGGVAIIKIKGPLFNVEGYFDELLAYYFGGTSYQSLMADIETVTNNPLVQVVGFYVHSPGGEAFGMNETSNKIAALTAVKPTIGYAYGFAASAGYGLIAATGEIIADANAWVGSIGVVCGWADYTGMYEQVGIAYEEVTSSNAPYKRLDIRIPEERAVFMQQIDGVEDVFIKSVAKNRKISVDKVKSDFGQGAVVAGKPAKSAGMIDDTGSWDDVLRRLQTKAKKANKASANTSAGDSNMSLGKQLKALFGSKEVQSILATDDDAPETAIETDPPAATEGQSGSQKVEEPATTKPPVEQPAAAIEQQLAGFRTIAEAFASSEIQAGRMSPREKDGFIEDFAQAAHDDTLSPLASGSRVERLKTRQSSRKPSLLTEETVNAENNQVLLAQSGGANADEKKEKLLSSTQLGKRTLQLKK